MFGEGFDFSGFDRENWKFRNFLEYKRVLKCILEEISFVI